MKLLIAEDNDLKYGDVETLVHESVKNSSIDRAKNLAEVVRYLNNEDYDLIVLDFMLPYMSNTAPVSVALELINLVDDSRNKLTDVFALTSYASLIESSSDEYGKAGVIICEYGEGSSWRVTFASLLRKHSHKIEIDFLIICALEKERDALRETEALISEPMTRDGLNICEIELNGRIGYAVLCPRMGLVNASVITTIAIERFCPKVVSMLGICAGISEETEIGQVIIADPCFEYQAGKYSPTGFAIEPYQIDLPEPLRQKISISSNDSLFNQKVYDGIPRTVVKSHPAKFGPFASGSSVVADKEKIEQIQIQHRKLCGLDMEVYGVMRAARLANEKVLSFAAKVVVDHADESKGDEYHEIGTVVSARAVTYIISCLFESE